MPMLAPAEKNFSPDPVTTITSTSSSKRASKIASSSWRIISCVYVLAGGSFISMQRDVPFAARVNETLAVERPALASERCLLTRRSCRAVT